MSSRRLAADTIAVCLALAPMMLPVCGCSSSDTPPGTIVLGEQTIAQDLTASSHVAVTGNLVQGLPSTVTISCQMGEAAGLVQSITVDLSQVGGPAALPLTADGTSWSGYATVTPTASGLQTVTCTAVDGAGLTSSASTTVQVALPLISNITVTGSLTKGQPCMVALELHDQRCRPDGADGYCRSFRRGWPAQAGHGLQQQLLDVERHSNPAGRRSEVDHVHGQ